MRARWIIAAVAAAGLAFGLSPVPAAYAPAAVSAAPDIDAWVAQKQAESAALGVRAGDDERLVRASEGRTPLAILYVHGFGASRAEGEAVVDTVAAELGANVYFLRLPGHGLDDMDAHAAATTPQYLDVAEEALAQMPLLGDRTVIVGTSAGGLLATWLAAQHPDQVAALVVASPFYDFVDPTAWLADKRIGLPLIEAIYGDERDAGWKSDPEQRVQPGYNGHWTTKQRYGAVQNLAILRRVTATPETFAAVRAPTLLLYYYRDEDHQDRAASVPAMLEAMSRFGGEAGPDPRSRAVAIEDGEHVLMSAYIRTDKERILAEILSFLREVGGEAG